MHTLSQTITSIAALPTVSQRLDALAGLDDETWEALIGLRASGRVTARTKLAARTDT